MSRSTFTVKALIAVVCLIVGLLIGMNWAPTALDSDVTADIPELKYPPRGGSLALGSQRFVYLPLNNPSVVSATSASHMQGDDIISGIVVNGQPRAYPQWILVAYHVVNDTIQEEPVMVAQCEICSGNSAFRPVVEGFDGRSLSFQIHGIARGTFTVYDYPTQTVWSPFTGRTLEGELHPSRMERVPLIVESWDEWVKRHPDTDVVVADRRMIETREHGRGDHNQIGHEYIPEGFQQVANMGDTRLAHNALIFGLTSPSEDESTVFPLELLDRRQELIRHRFAGEEFLVKKIGRFAVVALRVPTEMEERQFHLVSIEPFRVADDQGRVWDEFGHSRSEDGEQQDMAVADGYFTEWYEWVSSYPGSGIVEEGALQSATD